jgi:hypothetical protein
MTKRVITPSCGPVASVRPEQALTAPAARPTPAGGQWGSEDFEVTDEWRRAGGSGSRGARGEGARCALRD